MQRNRSIARTDIALVCFLGLIMALLVFLSLAPGNYAEMNLLVCAQVITLLTVYFSGSLVAGLSMAAAVVLVYGGYQVYQCLTLGIVPPARLFFFVLWVPLMTFTFWSFVSSVRVMQKANGKMQEALDTLKSVDERTGLANMRAYINMAPIYMSISRRYRISLGIVIGRAVSAAYRGKELTTEELTSVSMAVENAIRTEDEIFIITDRTPYIFAVMMLMVRPDDGAIVLDRMSHLDIPDSVRVELGYYSYQPETEDLTAQSLLERALESIDNSAVNMVGGRNENQEY